MVLRQPGDTNCFSSGSQFLSSDEYVVREVAVCDHDPLGFRSGARGVLQEGDALWINRHHWEEIRCFDCEGGRLGFGDDGVDIDPSV
jgi:hypothetical protein